MINFRLEGSLDVDFLWLLQYLTWAATMAAFHDKSVDVQVAVHRKKVARFHALAPALRPRIERDGELHSM